MSRFTFRNPVESRFGRGVAAEQLGGEIEPPALVVTGAATLDRAGLRGIVGGDVAAFEKVSPNPGAATVNEATRQAAALGARTVVGLGGGSALDAAKSVAVLIGNGDDVAELLPAAGAAVARHVRLVQVPTTAGTGSEVTPWASLWDGGRKWSVDTPAAFADVALVDPALTDSMGPRLTAASGLDAFAHAVEAMWGRHAAPASDALAAAALREIGTHLPAAVAGGGEAARDGMALGALLAGLALSQTRSAAAHALSYAMTARRGLEHGLAVGLLCRALLPFNAVAAPEAVDRMLAALGVPDLAAAQAFVDRVLDAAGLAPSLAALGVPREDHDAIVAQANPERFANNPGELAAADVRAALESIA